MTNLERGRTRQARRSTPVLGTAAGLALSLVACSAGAAPSASGADAATFYEDYYVPALFGSWATRVADAAAIAPGDAVLDVACGTGVLARVAVERAGDSGSVTGLDIDPTMLAVARRIAPDIRWDLGDAQSLPYADASFDVVTCQFGLMFFPDKVVSIREMLRVAKPGGRIVIAVWAPLESSPGYARLVKLVARHMGDDVANLIRTPFGLGDEDELARLCAEAGVPSPRIATHEGVARFPSIRSWVETEVRGWIGLTQDVDEARLATLLDDAERELRPWESARGEVRIGITARFVLATVP